MREGKQGRLQRVERRRTDGTVCFDYITAFIHNGGHVQPFAVMWGAPTKFRLYTPFLRRQGEQGKQGEKSPFSGKGSYTSGFGLTQYRQQSPFVQAKR
jgi:hypothetical protein